MRRTPALLTLVCVLLLTACLNVSLPGAFTSASPPDRAARQASLASDPPTQEATLMAVGDIMVHSPQLPGYLDAATKRYDFSGWFERVSPLFQEGDWVIGNLETPLAGADLKFTGYPKFNAPEQLAVDLREAGFDLVSTANNHAMDRGFAGVQRTLRNVRKAGLIPVGTAESPKDAERTAIVDRGGIRMGFLAYTYGTNGIPISKDKAYSVNLIDPKRMAGDIAKLRKAGADVVTVSLHFGTEYERLPNDQQRKIVRSAIGSGADIILGSHPHVVQPYDVVSVPASESGLKQNRKGVVIYSLGNFVSNQSGDWKDVGLIFSVHVVKKRQPDGSSLTTWDRIGLTPTAVHIENSGSKRHYTVLPIRQTLDERKDASLTEADYADLKAKLAGIEQHLHTYEQ
ncbi:CapA family protein [Cohnella candidum]|uniref:CapA family protein n=1 Tax=Cohnella candidum TaxID=2674991 RepID=UPI0013DE1845|nr:CapA family protein [Cohnella candidum]